MADVVIQAQSTLFNRQGITRQSKGYLLPAPLAPYIAASFLHSYVPDSLRDAAQIALQLLLAQNSQIIPGGLTLFDIQDIDPTLFPGASALESIYQQDPFSSDYETETNSLYERAYSVARAAAQSGPTNIRGGTARQALELAELGVQMSNSRFREIWQNQLAMCQVVIQATQVANASEEARRNSQLKAQQQQAATEQGRVVQTLGAAEQITRDREQHLRALAASAEFLGLPNMATEETLQGEGFQGGVTTGFGMSYWR